jgi:hypothetical protein
MNPPQRWRKSKPRRPLRSPLPPLRSEAPAVEATLPEASVVEGEYSAQVQLVSESSRSRQVRLIHLSLCRQVLKPREAISRRGCPLKMWHWGLRELREEPPSRWKWPSEKPPRRLEERAMMRCQNPLWR